jgi:transcription elongation GreA/GreB family factor
MPKYQKIVLSDEPIYLTAEGLRRLEARLARLKAALPGYIEETARTAAYGDRSDNAEYKDAKGKLRSTHRQIFNIEDQLKRVILIEEGRNAAGTVRIGSRVVLEDGEKKITLFIVGPQETDPSRGRISHLSPLGAALIGKKEGDTATIPAPQGARSCRLLEVE